MTGKFLISAIAAAAMVAAGPALAQGRGGGGSGGGQGVGGGGAGGGSGGPGGGMGAGGGAGIGGGGFGGGAGAGFGAGGNVGTRIGDVGATTREQARQNSRGPENASATGIANANENSVLAGSTVVSGPLTGLVLGMSVTSSNGIEIGTVEKIVASSDGTIRRVLVRAVNGRVFSLAPNNLSLSGGTLTALTLVANRESPSGG